MKRIEERAKREGIISQLRADYPYDKKSVEFGYIQGAYDQKEIITEKMLEQNVIDIDKACEWLKENARDYACATIRCPYGEEEEIICDVHREIVEDFRKAMEE